MLLLKKKKNVVKITNTLPAFSCPKSSIETPEKDTNHTQSQK